MFPGSCAITQRFRRLTQSVKQVRGNVLGVLKKLPDGSWKSSAGWEPPSGFMTGGVDRIDNGPTKGVVDETDGEHRLALLVSVVILVLSTPARGRQLPAPASSLETRDEREAFLARASFATDAPTDGRPSWRAGLADGNLTHDASVVVEDGSGPTRRNCRFNVAAYELDKLLGLNLVPPSVERTINGRPASVTWWLDNFAMNELDRRRKGIDPPDADSWVRQVQAVRVFDELISNTYRDTAPPLYLNSVWDNLLITTDWTV